VYSKYFFLYGLLKNQALLAQLQCDTTFRTGFPYLATLLQTDHRATKKPVFVEIPRTERGTKRQRIL